MRIAVFMIVGLIMGGGALYFLTRKHAAAAAWTALVLGLIGSVLLLGMLSSWFLPQAGAIEAAGTGLLSGIATALALGCLLRGERKPINWVALAVSAPPVLFLIVFGIGELLSPH